jgi:hypothetical protein
MRKATGIELNTNLNMEAAGSEANVHSLGERGTSSSPTTNIYFFVTGIFIPGPAVDHSQNDHPLPLKYLKTYNSLLLLLIGLWAVQVYFGLSSNHLNRYKI